MQAIAAQFGFLILLALAGGVAVWAMINQVRMEEQEGLRQERLARQARQSGSKPRKRP